MRASCLRLLRTSAILVAALLPLHAGPVAAEASHDQLPGASAVGAEALLPASVAAEAKRSATVDDPTSARFIVKLRTGATAAPSGAAPAEMDALAARNALRLIEVRYIVAGMHLLRVTAQRGGQGAADILAQLRADPQVEYAEPDYRRHPLALPNDPLFADQWYLQNLQPAATDAVTAWNSTTGSPGLVIADLDTGVRFDHPDLRSVSANRLLPGYNMISNPTVANNTYGRGPDASDPGDWVSSSDLKNPLFANCMVSNSSWHGTRTAGILGAITDNAAGIAGMTWQGWIEPVRVLGKCGGYDSDIIAGMAWAAGNVVDGVPANPYPAQILNMSLGGTGSCPASYQQIIDQLVSEGVLVVVSAGNEGGPVDSPANCVGVAAIAGLREVGSKVGYSSLGPQIALSAPAGNCVNTGAGQPCLFSIETTTNSGTTVPQTNTYTNQYNFNIGTSFAAPIVTGIAGLMRAVNGNLTPGQLIARLQAGAATPFPASPDPDVPTCHVPASQDDLQTAECNCTTATCGAGMANADGAVLQALRPIAAVSMQLSFRAGSTVTLDGSGSVAACNASIASYHWTVLQPSANPPAIGNAHGAVASIVAPQSPASYTLELTVTDNYGRSDNAIVVVHSSSATTTAPARAGDDACLPAVSFSLPTTQSVSGGTSSGSSGGGGGALDLLSLALLTLGGACRALWRAHSSRCAASSQERCARR